MLLRPLLYAVHAGLAGGGARVRRGGGCTPPYTNAVSSDVDVRPSIALRPGKRPKREIIARLLKIMKEKLELVMGQ